MAEYIIVGGELYHYGVKGMKWGHRKALPVSDVRRRFDSAKSNYKQANKAYNKSFNKAENRNLASFSPIKKHRDASTQRWTDAIDKGQAANKAKAEYKSAKKARKNAIKNAYKEVTKDSSRFEKIMYNDNNMSMSDAKKKANRTAINNTAVILAGFGASAVLSTLR